MIFVLVRIVKYLPQWGQMEVVVNLISGIYNVYTYRTLDHSTVLYETDNNNPIVRL